MIDLLEVNTFDEISKMDCNSVDLVLTDPPYEMDRDSMRVLHDCFMDIARRAVIVFSKPENQWDFGADHYLFWNKPISTKNTSKQPSRFVEMIFVYQRESWVWNSGRHWSNYVNRFDDRLIDARVHRCQKPRSLMKRLILNYSTRGDTILDPFAGSGTTLIEAEKVGRDSIGFEKKSKNIEIIESRIGKV